MNGNDEDCEEPSTARRFEVDTIDGLEVFSFSNSAELEFFSNHVSPFTSKDDCDFRGFEEGGTSAAEYRSFFKKSLKRLLPNDDSVLVDANFPKPIKSICKQKTNAKLIPNPKISSSIFDDAVIDVVDDLVDFVSRKESFGRIPVLQDPKTGSDLSKLPPCGKEYCVLGCVCYSVSRKITRRLRCSNADCILECCCWAKSVRLRSGYVRPPERFEILKGAEPVLTNEVTTFSAPATKKPKPSDGSMQPPAFESRILQKPESEQPPSKADNIGSIDKLIAPYRSLSFNKWKPNGIRKPHYSPWETFKKKKPVVHVVEDVHNKSVHKQYPLHSKSANNKVEEISKEVPPHALMCLTPGVGFLPLEELTLTKIQFRNPFAPSVVKNFSSVKSATEWLDKMCEEKFTYGPDITHLKWMVADAQIIKRKEFKHMDINALTDPRCQITRTGLVFT